MINYIIISLILHLAVCLLINAIDFENKTISNASINIDLVYMESNESKINYETKINKVKLEKDKNIKNILTVKKINKVSNMKILNNHELIKDDVNNNYYKNLEIVSEFTNINIHSIFNKLEKKITNQLDINYGSFDKYYNNLYNNEKYVQLSNNSNSINKNFNNRLIKTPKIQVLVKPNYPIIARLRGMEGIVIIQVVLSEKGNIKKINITKNSGHSILDKAALEAVMRSKFIPAEIDNKYVKSTIKFPVRFSLNN